MDKSIYEIMTEKIFLTGSKIIPKLFKMIANQNEAELLMAMPGTVEQLSEKVGKPVEEINRMCGELYRKGLSFKSFNLHFVCQNQCFPKFD